MYVKSLEQCTEITAGDGTALKEIFSGERDGLALRYSLAFAHLPPDHASRPHRLKTSEVYFITSGSGVMQIDGERQHVGPGDTIYIPPGAIQNIESTGPGELEFICIVDPAWQAEDEEIL